MLKPRELQSEEVELDGVTYRVTAMTVRKRTNFEAALVSAGADRIREALLVFCVETVGKIVDGKFVEETPRQAFSPSEFADTVEIDETGLTKAQIEERREAAALELLLDYLADFPSNQLEPLVQAAQRVNDLLGNGSAPN